MSYTKGPWRWIPDDETNDGMLCGPNGEWIVAGIWHNDGSAGCSARNDSDTPLIAAAPDLYEALKRVSEEAADDSPEMWAQVAAALRKAEGK